MSWNDIILVEIVFFDAHTEYYDLRLTFVNTRKEYVFKYAIRSTF